MSEGSTSCSSQSRSGSGGEESHTSVSHQQQLHSADASLPPARRTTSSSRTSTPANAPHTTGQSLPSSSPKVPSQGSAGSAVRPAPSTTPQQPTAPEARAEKVLPYSQNEIERVRQALADAGYTAPGAADIERVFQLVRSELEEQQQQHQRQPYVEASPYHVHNEEVDEARYRSSTSAGVPSATHKSHRVQSHPRARQSQQWDASTPASAPRYQGPRAAVDRSEPYRRGHGDSALHTHVEADGRASVPVYYRRGPHGGGGLPLDPRHPALSLPPAVRLERYMRRYERQLADYYSNGAADEMYGDNPEEAYYLNWPAEGEYAAQDERDAHRGPSPREASRGGNLFQASHVLSAPLEETEVPRGVSARPVDAATLRRSANTVFNITGDERYRYRPPMPQPRTTAPAYMGAGGGGRHTGSVSSRTRGTVPVAETYFNTQRAHPRNSRLLSTYTVSYLQPNGSTLRTKADPVTRGHLMRELWERDPFLSQRSWNAERWQARQAAMNYDDA